MAANGRQWPPMATDVSRESEGTVRRLHGESLLVELPLGVVYAKSEVHLSAEIPRRFDHRILLLQQVQVQQV